MVFNMSEEKRQLVKSKEKSDKGFQGAHGYKVEIKPGDNWILVSDLKHLKEQSDGFQHFLNRKRFVIKDDENSVRAETKEEKSLRLKLMEGAKSLVSKIRQKESEGSPQAPADLKKETESELSMFKDSLREESVKAEEEFIETLKKAADKAANDIDGLIKQNLEKAESEFVETINKIVSEQLEIKFDVDKFDKQLSVKATAALEQFATGVDKLLDGKFKTFETKLKSSAAKAAKAAK